MIIVQFDVECLVPKGVTQDVSTYLKWELVEKCASFRSMVM